MRAGRIILGCAAAGAALAGAEAVKLFRAGLVRQERLGDGLTKRVNHGRMMPYKDMILAERDWYRAQKKEQICLTSYDGLRLAAELLPAETPCGRTIILFHGYRSDAEMDFSCIFRYYHELGLNILAVSQRSHGQSEGKYICFGVRERFDCVQWAEYAAERFGPEEDIFLGGVSMGASTVLMASGLGLPENVRGIIADCGFSSPEEEFRYILGRAHIPVHPVMDVLDIVSGKIAGFRFGECSAVDAVKKSRVPILFVHGQEDDFVPPYMSDMAYEACASEKKIVRVDHAGHGMSYLAETERCREALRDFIESHCRQK